MLKLPKGIIMCLMGLLFMGGVLVTSGPGAAEKTPPFFEEEARPVAAEAPVEVAEPKKPDIYGRLAEEGFATEEYVVKEGDWLTKILREKGVLEGYDTDELLKILRHLNESLKNINVIRPGEKIVILVKVMPKKAQPSGGSEVAYHTHTVQPGDSLHQLAMARYGLSEKAFHRKYLPLAKKYNPEIGDLNIIHPGQKIRLPVYPPPPPGETARPSEPPSQPIERDVDPRTRVKLADRRVVNRAFNRPPPPEVFEREPNPPEQPEQPEQPDVPEVPDEPEPPEPADTPEPQETPSRDYVKDAAPSGGGMVIVVADGMGKVFTAMGEEWMDEGEHFIPMKSGGQINLKTENYPILRLQQGTTVIVDLSSQLPRKMVGLIESTWPSYRVVPIVPQDNLRTALGKILRACNYDRVFEQGEPLELGGSLRVQVTGDWIVAPPESRTGKGPRFIVISLTGPKTPPLPSSIKDYLDLMGIDVLEYPPLAAKAGAKKPAAPAKKATDTASLIQHVLDMTGRVHNTRHKIKAFSSRKDDFELTVEADFYFQNQGREAVIDLNGMDPKVISLLKDRGVEVLSLSGVDGMAATLGKLLKFLHLHYEQGPHTFTAVPGPATTNVRLTLPGVVFQNPGGGSVIATESSLPPQIIRFLEERGYRVLVLSPSPARDKRHA